MCGELLLLAVKPSCDDEHSSFLWISTITSDLELSLFSLCFSLTFPPSSFHTLDCIQSQLHYVVSAAKVSASTELSVRPRKISFIFPSLCSGLSLFCLIFLHK